MTDEEQAEAVVDGLAPPVYCPYSRRIFRNQMCRGRAEFIERDDDCDLYKCTKCGQDFLQIRP